MLPWEVVNLYIDLGQIIHIVAMASVGIKVR